MNRYNFWLLADETEELRKLAKQYDVSLSDMVRRAISDYLMAEKAIVKQNPEKQTAEV
jgi:hypothetical protein